MGSSVKTGLPFSGSFRQLYNVFGVFPPSHFLTLVYQMGDDSHLYRW